MIDLLELSLFAVAAWMIWRGVVPYLRARRLRGRAVPSVVSTDAPPPGNRQLIYFFSPSCGMCRDMTRTVDRLLTAYPDLAKVNVMEHLELARSYGIAATPTLVLVDGGKVEKVLLGARSERTIRELLDPR